ncbi:uncharacterized protein BDCG_16846 [Blastomyces dermatitidis ER-3]|nr:uncharacterized protein BDCG_16846 [Blastomyces dermatitidis ER-3]EQL32727.1 hypothetical protein BDFG_05117 [Blastomyces dermatitidis ATCC 26199]OAT01013.1 hypothetical protein BDCG_16846 [Blastomyces dermatitidis ER-3]
MVWTSSVSAKEGWERVVVRLRNGSKREEARRTGKQREEEENEKEEKRGERPIQPPCLAVYMHAGSTFEQGFPAGAAGRVSVYRTKVSAGIDGGAVNIKLPPSPLGSGQCSFAGPLGLQNGRASRVKKHSRNRMPSGIGASSNSPVEAYAGKPQAPAHQPVRDVLSVAPAGCPSCEKPLPERLDWSLLCAPAQG